MNKDRQTKSSHPVQRLNTKQSGTAAPVPGNRRPPAGDVITYRDSKGQVITEEDDENYDDRPLGHMPRSSLRRSSFADVQTEEQGKLVLPPQQQAFQQLPRGVVYKRGVPCAFINGYWTKLEYHEGEVEDFYPSKPYPHRNTEALTPVAPASRRPRRFHWLFFVGIAALLMIGGWFFLNMFTGWLQVKRDDILYGRPRTFQTDAVVGHNDSPTNPSHFQCINLDRRIQIIEFPGGDSSKAKIYMGPTLIGPDQDLTPCILTFEDVTGKGKLDMVLSIGGTIFVMLNDGKGFRPPQPGEHISVK